MAHVISYSHIVMATAHEETWDELWFLFATWKGMLQSFPGHQRTRLAAMPLENGDIRIYTATSWEYPEQLDEWLSGEWTADKLFAQVNPPAYDIEEAVVEDFS